MPRKPTPADMITPVEAAKRLGISVDTLRTALQRGEFPVGWAHRPTGGNWVYCIPRLALENLMTGKAGIDMERLAAMVAEKVLAELKGA